MAATQTIPVNITPEAASWIEELGIQDGVDKAVDAATRILAGMNHLRLAIEPTYEDDDFPYWLILECHGNRTDDEVRAAMRKWYTWRADNLPVQVGRHLIPTWIDDRERP